MFTRKRRAISEESDPTYTVHKQGVAVMKPQVKRKSVSKKKPNAVTLGHMCEIIDEEIRDLSKAKNEFDFQAILNEVDKTDTGHLIFMANNINQLYMNKFSLYPVQIVDLLKFLNFYSIYEKFITEDSISLYELMSRKHNQEVYIHAATFMFFVRSDIKTARLYFTHGKKYYKNSKKMHLKDFEMEVKEVENTDSESLPIAFQKFKESMEEFPGDLQFHLKLLDISLDTKSARRLQYEMIKEMVEVYKYQELMWQKLAKINYSGIIYSPESGIFEHCSKNYEKRMMKSFEAFDIGIKQMDHSRKKQFQLWVFYAEHILDIWKSLDVVNKRFDEKLTNNMKRVFQILYNIKLLPKQYYAYWAEFSNENCEKVILDRAINMNKDSTKVWKIILTRYLKLNLFDTAKRVLFDAFLALKKNSFPLWRFACNNFERKADIDWVHEFYSSAVLISDKDMCTEFRIRYLKWHHQHQGILEARKFFRALILMEPVDSQLYLAMISLEKAQHFIEYKIINKLYVELCGKFFQHDTSLWVEAIKFNYSQKNSAEAEEIYNTASSILNKTMMSDLQKKIEILQKESNVRFVRPRLNKSLI